MFFFIYASVYIYIGRLCKFAQCSNTAFPYFIELSSRVRYVRLCSRVSSECHSPTCLGGKVRLFQCVIKVAMNMLSVVQTPALTNGDYSIVLLYPMAQVRVER